MDDELFEAGLRPSATPLLLMHSLFSSRSLRQHIDLEQLVGGVNLDLEIDRFHRSPLDRSGSAQFSPYLQVLLKRILAPRFVVWTL